MLYRDELATDWDPQTDTRLTAWEVMQNLIRALNSSESDAARLLTQVGGLGEVSRDLAYRLYSICERKRWSQEAAAYNTLVTAWPEITRLAASATPAPGRLF
jgi:putative DNA methylase